MCCRLLKLSTLKTAQLHHPTPGCAHLNIRHHLPSPRDSRQIRRITPVSFLPPKYYKSAFHVVTKIQAIKISHSDKYGNLLTQVMDSNFHPTPGLPITNQLNVLICKQDWAIPLQGQLTSYRPCLFYCLQLPALSLRSYPFLCPKHSHLVCN